MLFEARSLKIQAQLELSALGLQLTAYFGLSQLATVYFRQVQGMSARVRL